MRFPFVSYADSADPLRTYVFFPLQIVHERMADVLAQHRWDDIHRLGLVLCDLLGLVFFFSLFRSLRREFSVMSSLLFDVKEKQASSTRETRVSR